MKRYVIGSVILLCCYFLCEKEDEIVQEAQKKVKKVENSKDVLEIFKTSLWLYRRGFYQDFNKLFKKAVEVDKDINKNNPKLVDILSLVKFETETANEESAPEDDEEDEPQPPKKANVQKSPPKQEKATVYDKITKKYETLLKAAKQDEVLYEDQLLKKSAAEAKIKKEREKVGWNFTTKLISPHFILYTDADMKSAIIAIDNLEAFFNTFYFFFYDSLDFKKFKNKKITVYIFSSRKDYNDFVEKRAYPTDQKNPLYLYYHLRRNDLSLFDVMNNASIASFEISESLATAKGKTQMQFVDVALSLPEIYKAVLENILFIYVFSENKKYAEVPQCLSLGMRNYFSYLIPGEVAFTIGSYTTLGDPNFDLELTKTAITENKYPKFKTLVVSRDFTEAMKDLKDTAEDTFIKIYTTMCYSLIYYLFHKANVKELEKVLQGLATPSGFTYDFFAKYIKDEKAWLDFTKEDLKNEIEKYKVK